MSKISEAVSKIEEANRLIAEASKDLDSVLMDGNFFPNAIETRSIIRAYNTLAEQTGNFKSSAMGIPAESLRDNPVAAEVYGRVFGVGYVASATTDLVVETGYGKEKTQS